MRLNDFFEKFKWGFKYSLSVGCDIYVLDPWTLAEHCVTLLSKDSKLGHEFGYSLGAKAPYPAHFIQLPWNMLNNLAMIEEEK
jgi:hypothetical protein